MEKECNVSMKHPGECVEHGECTMPEKFLELADEAYMELLKDKIKANIEKYKGEDMNKLAGIISEANGAKWHHLIQGKKRCHEYKSAIKEFFAGKCE